MKKIVFLPVETEVRELDAKLLMASKIIDEDTVCFVGQHNLLNTLAPMFNGGVYMGKNIFLENMNSSDDIYHMYKDNNFSILWNHEEGAIYGGSKDKWDNELKELLDPQRLHQDDMILCWGNYQKQYYDSYQVRVTCKVVGGYRLDLGNKSGLRSMLKEINRVKDEGYILIDTNCAWGNHFLPHQQEYKIFQEKSASSGSDHLTSHNLVGLLSEDMIKIGYFCNLISYLMEANPDQKFVLRPHPTESIEFYQNVFHKFKNIKITKDYSAIEWINNCSLLIQSGCTTALEAYFLEKPIVSFHPFDSKYSVDVTKGIGHACKTYEDVNLFIQSPFYNPNIDGNELGIKELISNFDNDISSIDQIVTEIKTALHSKSKSPINLTKIRLIELMNDCKNNIKLLPRKLLFKDKQAAYEMAIDHFPGFNPDEINKKILALESITDQQINLKYSSKNLLIISA